MARLLEHLDDMFPRVLLKYLEKRYNPIMMLIPEGSTVLFDKQTGYYTIVFKTGGRITLDDISYLENTAFSFQHDENEYVRRMRCSLQDNAKQLYAAFALRVLQTVMQICGTLPDGAFECMSIRYDTDGEYGDSRVGEGMARYMRAIDDDVYAEMYTQCLYHIPRQARLAAFPIFTKAYSTFPFAFG